MIGSSLGPYQVVEKLGAGGMGEVYRARDTQLNRDVAIKVLPQLFAADADRLARLQREAQTLASLNHPNIAQIYGIERSGATRALVMELIEGADLSTLIARGPLDVATGLDIARQIADALEAAHERGIVHRDLKPANVKVRDDGVVKVLDFGLAKLADQDSTPGFDPQDSPTFTSPARLRQGCGEAGTEVGVVLGTAAYMAPEQAKGKPVDKRADVWAFGCVLFEMLTGHAPFAGETISDVIASILTAEPHWTRLPVETPASVRRLLRRCLEKDPKRRLRDIADARLELEAAGDRSDSESHVVTEGRRISWTAAAVLVVAAAALGVGLAWIFPRAGDTKEIGRQYVVPRAGFSEFALTAISPDGRTIAFVPARERGPFELYLQSMDSLEPRLVGTSAGTALEPFFSPDSRWLAYFNDDYLVKVPVAGGPPVNIMPSGSQRLTGAWGPDGSIVVASAVIGGSIQDGLARVLPDGRVDHFTTAQQGEVHLGPEFTAGGEFVLFSVVRGQSSSIAAVPAAGGPHRVVIPDARSPRHSPTGHLLYQHPGSGEVFAVRFDAARAEARSDPVRIATAASVADSGAYAISREGTLVYSAPTDTAPDQDATLVRIDRAGVIAPLMEDRGAWAQPRFSPDGLAVLFRAIQVPDCHLWVLDLERGTRTRITTEADNHDPVWHPDGRRIHWTASASGSRKLVSTRIDSDGVPQAMLSEDTRRWRALSWSADGTRLLLTLEHSDTERDIYVLSAGTEEARPLLATRFNEDYATFSPDGRWFAYVSNESGRDEVYLRRYEGEPGRIQISANGGTSPRWSRDGRELFYTEGPRMMVADVRLGDTATASRPRQLFEGPFDWERPDNWDVSADGRGFIMVLRQEGRIRQATLRVVVNWTGQLRR
jgi:eukaryotic-like serine/threonine-protein kinase